MNEGSTTTTSTDDYHALAKTCMSERYWPYYVISIVASFLGGLVIILIHRALTRFIAWIQKRRLIRRYRRNLNWQDSGDNEHGDFNTFLDVPRASSKLSGLDQNSESQEANCIDQFREIRVRFVKGE